MAATSAFSDLKSAQSIVGDRAKVLVHGRTGSGKSTAAASMAEVGKVLYLYFPGEEGINSVKGMPHDDRIMLKYVEKSADLTNIYMTLLSGNHDIDTVVVDSTSALQTCMTKSLMGIPWDGPLPPYEGRGYSFWGDLGNYFTDFFTNWYALASHTRKRPINVVMTAQTALKEIQGMGIDKFQPDLAKGPLAAALSRPDFIFFTQVEDPGGLFAEEDDDSTQPKFTIRVKPSENIEAKIHADVTKAMKVPAVLRAPKGADRLTLPMVLKGLGITLA